MKFGLHSSSGQRGRGLCGMEGRSSSAAVAAAAASRVAVCLYGGEDQRAVLLDRVEDEQLADGRADGHDAHVRQDRRVGAEEGDDGHDLERDEQACVQGARDPVGRGWAGARRAGRGWVLRRMELSGVGARLVM